MPSAGGGGALDGKPARIGFLLSGSGRTLENLADSLSEHPGRASIACVISSRADVRGVEIARSLRVPVEIEPCRTPEASRRIFDLLEAHGVGLAVLGGWLRKLEIPATWLGRVINIHPSLLPEFGGRGFYGRRVHEAVIEAGRSESGCSVHFVDDEYDHGPTILQRKVPVEPNDTPETLAARVFEAECVCYPEAIELVTSGAVKYTDGHIVRE